MASEANRRRTLLMRSEANLVMVLLLCGLVPSWAE
jgi:hypothetical protein